ncbi:MAG: M15 family metallopeptidase [Rhizobiales bacterium]|nr:M15 family metallopeptidase [Hyphomicrobiales bacterium]
MKSIVTAALLALGAAAPAMARDALPAGMVYLREVDATIVQDMRYAGIDNFVGRPLPGYGAAECVLRREMAQALARVQADLARQQLSLKVYDCYRPRRAVAAMARWAEDGATADPTKRFYPALEKRNLFALGYIAAQSAHSTGTAIDLTLIKLPAQPAAAFDRGARYGACTGPAAQRAPDNGLDMGTGFDCFDARSHTRSDAIAAEQKRARLTLNAAMRQHGFKNYFREWWHFTYALPDARSHDFPIGARGR